MNLSTVSLFKNLNTNNDNYVHLEGELLRKFQLELVSMMDDIHQVCVENNIVYSLCGGSALGAYRHKGFIPWDDDMDIFMLSKDKDLFQAKFLEKFKDKYWVHTERTPGIGMPIGRVRLKNSVYRGREDVDVEECGFFIDIFWIENCPDNQLLYKLHGSICMLSGFLLSCRNFYKNKELMTELLEINTSPEIKRVFNIKIFVGRLLSFMTVERCAIINQWFYGLCKKNNSKRICIPSGRKHYFGETFLREDIVATRDMEFEGRMYKVPKNVETYMTTMYGDYMKIPKEEDREKHILLEIKFPDGE